jgi:hypothetical protein
MHSRLSQHLQENSILGTQQYGSRKRISTEDAASRLTGSAFKLIHQKMHNGGISYDMAKVFGCVNH